MENVIYKTIVIPAKESQDGESPTILYVTKEVNGFLLLRESYDGGTEVLDYNTYNGYGLIEKAVDLGRKERAEIAETCALCERPIVFGNGSWFHCDTGRRACGGNPEDGIAQPKIVEPEAVSA